MISHFFAMLSRMKLINRWGLMRNTSNENLCEHALETAIIAHALAVIENEKFGANIDPNKVAVYAIYHDSSEILTGDMPTPVKYYNPKIKKAYKEIENISKEKLISFLPDDLKYTYSKILFYNKDKENNKIEQKIIKAADKISALIKCIEEEKAGNKEFVKAYESLMETVEASELNCVKIFIKQFLPSYKLTLDEQE